MIFFDKASNQSRYKAIVTKNIFPLNGFFYKFTDCTLMHGIKVDMVALCCIADFASLEELELSLLILASLKI